MELSIVPDKRACQKAEKKKKKIAADQEYVYEDMLTELRQEIFQYASKVKKKIM